MHTTVHVRSVHIFNSTFPAVYFDKTCCSFCSSICGMADQPTCGRKFRTTFTYSEGFTGAKIFQCHVLDVNLVNWTVNVVSKYDSYSFFDIPVASPYLHHSRGEGLSVAPEVGATALVCIPSDTSTPFVMAFLMVSETIDTATEEDPNGTTGRSSTEDSSSAASFGGGRPRAKPGDIWLRTRDNNFVILHRGGVLQLGADELAQRIYIPMNHLVMDISQDYAHHNSGGSIIWGLQEGAGQTSYPSEYTQTFRVLANDKYADVRVKVGKVKGSVPEAGENNYQSDIDQLGLQPDIVSYEVVIIPGGFEAETGFLADQKSAKNVRFKFFIDRAGGTFVKASGSIFVGTPKKIRLKAEEGVEINSGKGMSLEATAVMQLKSPSMHLKGDLVRLGSGSLPVATQGSMVMLTLPGTPLFVPGGPPVALYGTIVTGNPTVLA